MSSSPIVVVETHSDLIIRNAELALEFDKATYNLRSLTSLRTGGKVLLAPAGQLCPTWSAVYINAKVGRPTLSSGSECTRSHQVAGDTVTFTWAGIKLGDGTVDATVTVRLEGGLSYWQIALHNKSTNHGLWTVHLPQFTDMHFEGRPVEEEALILTEGWGRRVTNPRAREQINNWKLPWYPSVGEPLQFFAFENGGDGLYIATHDGEARVKNVSHGTSNAPRPRLEGAAGRKLLNSSIAHYAEGMGEVRPKYEMKFPVVLGMYQGGWETAAETYRAWVLGQPWTRKGRVDQRRDIPKWLLENPVWLMLDVDRGGFEKNADLAERFVKELGTPAAIQWYNWHQIHFDTNYPDYFPHKEGFEPTVERLRKSNIRSVPYINGRLMDFNSQSFLTENGDQSATYKQGARLNPTWKQYHADFYAEQGQAVMCPATKYWQDKISRLCDRIVNELGCDGVYIDQIAAAEGMVCMGKEHGHDAGGGDYWARGYRELLNKCREKIGDKILITECNAEPYMDGLAAYLMIHATHTDAIPIFPRVYHDRVLTYGNAFSDTDLDDGGLEFVTKLAVNFVWGVQLGWFVNPVLEKLLKPESAKALAYLKNVNAARYKAGKYLSAGRMLTDPQPTAPLPKVTSLWHMWGNLDVEMKYPAVLASAWEAPDGNIGITATNVTDSAVAVTWNLPWGKGQEHRDELAEGPWQKIEGNRLQAIIPGRSAFVASIR